MPAASSRMRRSTRSSRRRRIPTRTACSPPCPISKARAAGWWRFPASCPSRGTCRPAAASRRAARVRDVLRERPPARDRTGARPPCGLHPCQECARLSEPLLEAEGLVRHYEIRRGSRLFGHAATLRAVDGVSFDLQPGRTLGLVGESGCGKTTTAKLVLGSSAADRGRNPAAGRDLARGGIDALARTAPRHADGLPGSAGGARSAHRGRPTGHGAAGHPRHRRACRAARQGAGDHAGGRAAGAPLRPLSARAVGRPAPADRAGARADPLAAAAGLRRADLGARRVDPGAGRQSAARPAGSRWGSPISSSATICAWSGR